jgi:hypothetical protein
LSDGGVFVPALGDGVGRDLQSFRVGAEGVGSVAVDIAGELIEEDEDGERAVWFEGPVVELALAGGLDELAELLLALVVEAFGGHEPF